MKSIPQYTFHKTKYGDELLIDVVELVSIKKYFKEHPVHTLSYFDITFITKGSGLFSIDDKQYVVNPGDVIFSMPGEVREWVDCKCLEGFALIFEEEFLHSFFNDPLFLQNLSYFGMQRNTAKISISNIQTRIDYLIQSIISEINNDQSKDNHILRALLYEILMLLNREYVRFDSTPKEDFKTVNRYENSFVKSVQKNFKTHHDTKYYADQLCITPNYLNEIIQKTMGLNAKLYIQNKIILEAKKLLTYTSLSVSEIADTLSFESTSYFIRLFRNHTKQTPLQYRSSTKR